MRLYACGYNGSSELPGIQVFDTDGSLVGGCACEGVVNPSFAVVERAQDMRRLMYAACEMPDRAKLAAFELDDAGIPHLVDSVEFDGAAGTCHVAVDPLGHRLYGANYDSGSICECSLSSDGRLGDAAPLVQHLGHGPKRESGDPNYARQLTAHVHTLSFVPKTSLLCAVDLGEDTIAIYDTSSGDGLSATEVACKVEVPSGCGPRIVAYHPLLPYAAVVCELSCEVLIYEIGDDGTSWTLVERHGLIDGDAADWTAGNSSIRLEDGRPPLAAHAEFSADGRFLYVSTRGTETISIFEYGPDGGFRPVGNIGCGGRGPRHFAISPDQRMVAVANQASDEIAVFGRDTGTGMLELERTIPFHQPSCVIWDEW